MQKTRKRVPAGTLGSIIRSSGIEKQDFWHAAHDNSFPPPTATLRDSLGLTDAEFATVLRVKEKDVSKWCAGKGKPSGAAERRCSDLAKLVEKSRDKGRPWPSDHLWKWIRTPHRELQGRTPLERMPDEDRLSDLGRLP